MSHRHQWKTWPHEQLGAVLALFFFFTSFFCNFTEMKTADDLLQWTVTEVRARSSSSR